MTSASDGYANDTQWSELMRSNDGNRLEKIIGIFKNEPQMDALMERVREDRRLEAEMGMS